MNRISLVTSACIALALGLVGAAPLRAQPATAPPAPACGYTATEATVAVPGRPFLGQASADGCWLFVSMSAPDDGRADWRTGAVAVLHNEGGAFRLVRSVPVKDSPGGLALSHDGRMLVVPTLASVVILDVDKLESGAADAQAALLPMGAGAVYVALSPDDRLLFVSQARRPKVAVYDFTRARRGDDGAALGLVPVGVQPVGLAFSEDGRRLYSTSESVNPRVFTSSCPPEVGSGASHPEGALSVIDVAVAARDPDNALLAIRGAGCDPVKVALSPDGARAWVIARGNHRLQGFTTADLKGISAVNPEIVVQVGPAPVGLAVRPDGAQVWVANSNRHTPARRGTLTAVSADGKVLRTLDTGRFPRDLSFLPDGKTLVVAQYDSQAVQFVPTDTP